jgi:S1-C subfamily serine protease
MGSVKESQLRQQAATIGAQIVLVASRYTNTISGAVPLVMPTTSTTTSNGVATISGSGGTATVAGSISSTTQSSRTMMMPYSIARGDFTALYFVRVRTRLGLSVVPLDDSARLRLQTNSGVAVQVVVEGSPAFDADILPGDILLQIGSDRVRSVEHFSELIDRYEGRTVDLVLDRHGRDVRKSVRILTLGPA